MLSDDRSVDEGILLADSVRALAVQARRVLRRPANRGEVQALLMGIDQLEAEARTRRSEDLSRWLVSLRKRVEGHAMAMA